MIEKTIAYKTSDGVTFGAIGEAQAHELIALIQTADNRHNTGTDWKAEEIVTLILQHAASVIDILTMKPTSKPKARAINGGKKTRKPKATIAPPPIE